MGLDARLAGAAMGGAKRGGLSAVEGSTRGRGLGDLESLGEGLAPPEPTASRADPEGDSPLAGRRGAIVDFTRAWIARTAASRPPPRAAACQ